MYLWDVCEVCSSLFLYTTFCIVLRILADSSAASHLLDCQSEYVSQGKTLQTPVLWIPLAPGDGGCRVFFRTASGDCNRFRAAAPQSGGSGKSLGPATLSLGFWIHVSVSECQFSSIFNDIQLLHVLQDSFLFH